MAGTKLKLTRDQLATFLKDADQIRQFEKLFSTVSDLSTQVIVEVSVDAASAENKAGEAISQIMNLAQDLGIQVSVADRKSEQALAALTRIADALEMLSQAPSVQVGTLGQQQSDRVSISGGSINAQLKNNQTILLETTATLSDAAAANVGTLNNAPVVGNPTKWVAINDNGVTRYIPAW